MVSKQEQEAVIKSDGAEKQDIKPDGSKTAPAGHEPKEAQKSALLSEL